MQDNLLKASGIVPLERPEHCPGTYVMYFYCKYKNPDHPFQSHSSIYMEESDQVETRTAAIRQHRDNGGLYHADGTATCRLCAKAIRDAREARHAG